MSIPKPAKIALVVVLTYVVAVLVLRYRGEEMGWGPALLIGLPATPLVLLAVWGRDRLMARSRRSGERLRDRRRAAD